MNAFSNTLVVDHSESFETEWTMNDADFEQTAFRQYGERIGGLALLDSGDATARLHTLSPDMPGHVGKVNSFLKRQGGDIRCQFGVPVGFDYELITVFTSSLDDMKRTSEIYRRELADYCPSLAIFAQAARKKAEAVSFTLQSEVIDMLGVVAEISSAIAEEAGNIQFWHVAPKMAPFCGSELFEIRAIVDFPLAADVARIENVVDRIAFAYGGFAKLTEGVHLDTTS